MYSPKNYRSSPCSFITFSSESSSDMLHIYKNQLLEYAQKENLGYPVYTSEVEGPPHARRFKSRVTVDGKPYEALEFFPTLKKAEQAAAKVACQSLSVGFIQEDGRLYKNLLQEFAQKKGFLCPSYETVTSGMSHLPIFVSIVHVGTNTFQGDEGKTKKQAEMNAAKVAYLALTKVTESSKVSSNNECHVADNLSQNAQLTTTSEKHHDTENEEANSSPENMNMSVDPPLDGSNLQNSTPIEPDTNWKFVVFPRKLGLQIPPNAYVMPYSDDKWVAYKIPLGKEPTA